MIKEEMEKAINKQINAEIYSAYLYLSIRSYFQSLSLGGFSSWMQCQVEEELMHSMKLYDFVAERGGRVILDIIEKPETDWESPLVAFEQILEHEQLVSRLINNLMELAIKEKDHATQIFLQWFVSEQVEEEATAGEVVEKLKLIQDSSSGLFFLDTELGKRSLTSPSAE